MPHATFNRSWASLLLEALTRHDIADVCIAPGSRSAPLVLAAATNPKLTCHTHFDERGLGFLALGLAQSTGRPVAIIVTSGTAVANLYPALIEASLSGIKLVAVSADRPPELIGCGANQAITQPGIFASHVVSSLNLPRPCREIPARWLVTAIDTLMAQQRDGGGVHINCPFAEPLYGDATEECSAWRQTLGDWWQGSGPWLRYPERSAVQPQPDWFAWRQRRGVILVGRVSAAEGQRLAEWAGELGWPLLGDVLSQTGQPLPSAALWLAHPHAAQLLAGAEIVVQFGSCLTGKTLLAYQQNCQPEAYWLIDRLPGARDPACHGGQRIQADIGTWLDQHPALPSAPWCPQLVTRVADTRAWLAQHLSLFGEAQLAYRLPELLPEGGALFIGNSLAPRLVDAFAQLPAGYPLYSNRGASGIDGLLATAAGVQRGTAGPLLILLGDLSALYDLNSLALLQAASASVVILVVNNQGGQIFSLLPTPPDQRERFFAMPPRADFSHAAAVFGLAFQQATDWPQLCHAVQQGFCGGVTLIEVVVQGDEGAQTLAHCAREVMNL